MRREWTIAVLLAGITLALYWPVGRLGLISYDDPDYIVNNPAVQYGISVETISWALTSTQASNWHPITWLSHTLDCQLFGLNPGAFHLENLGFHIFNSLLLFIVLRKMTGAIWRSALVAALFAWHPTHIQSVAWISERKDMLSAFFMLLTLWAYSCHAQKVVSLDANKNTGLLTTKPYWLAVALFTLGLMSKPMLVTLPALLLLVDFWPLQRLSGAALSKMTFKKKFYLPDVSQLLWEKVPFALLSLVSVAITLNAQGEGGSIIPGDVLPWPTRLANVPVFYSAYLGKLFWPANLAIFYPYTFVPAWEKAGAALFLLLLTIFCVQQFRSRSWWLAGWLWFLIMLLPVIGLIQVGAQSIADRYTYLPSIGIFIIVVWSLNEFAASSCHRRTGIAIGCIAVTIACLADTHFQLGYWKDNITLTSHAIDVTNGNNFSCHFGLGNALMETGDFEAAATNFKAALRVEDTYPWKVNTFGIHHNFACALLLLDQPAAAEVEFRNALKQQPDDVFTHKYLGFALSSQGKTREAETEYATLMQLMPANPALVEEIEASKNLGQLMADLQARPTLELHVKIGESQARRGMYRSAIAHYQSALEFSPDSIETLNNLAWLIATCPQIKLRDGNRAIKLAERACELTYFRQTLFIGTLAAAYAEAGKFDEAIATAQRACDLAVKNGETDLARTNQELMELYRRHKSFPTAPL